jgi:hypothetical protein
VSQPAVNGNCGTSLSGAVQASTLVDTGYWKFESNGTFTINDTGSLSATPTVNASQVMPTEASCSGTYTLAGSKLAMSYSCTVNGTTTFVVQSNGAVTPTAILVEAAENADGTLHVTPIISNGRIVSCGHLAENTVISRDAAEGQ